MLAKDDGTGLDFSRHPSSGSGRKITECVTMKPATDIDNDPGSVCPRQMRVMLFDDHPLVNQGLETLLRTTNDLVLNASFSNEHEVMAEIEKQLPDLLILDLSLPGTSGLDILKDLHLRYPALKVLILSMREEDVYAERVLKAGAMGYIMKQEPGPEIIHAIRRVLSGNIYISRNVESKLLSRLISPATPEVECAVPEKLDDRELQVFSKIGSGLSTKQIADSLHLSPKTIQTYRDRIKRKLGLHHSCELIHCATRWVEGDSMH